MSSFFCAQFIVFLGDDALRGGVEDNPPASYGKSHLPMKLSDTHPNYRDAISVIIDVTRIDAVLSFAKFGWEMHRTVARFPAASEHYYFNA